MPSLHEREGVIWEEIMPNYILAVDFDGTLCESAWPDIGYPKQDVIDYVLEQQRNGAKLILWTNRCDEKLNEAVKWCKAHGIEFDAVNDNLPSMVAAFGNNCRKVYADLYLDDKNLTVDKVESYMSNRGRNGISRQKLTRMNRRQD